MTDDVDLLSLSAEEFAALDAYRLQEALQLLAGRMAVAQAAMRTNADGYHAYLEAKAEFTGLRQMASLLQTVLRSQV